MRYPYSGLCTTRITPALSTTSRQRSDSVGSPSLSPRCFFGLLIILGFSPDWVPASLTLGLFYQFFLHTQAVPRLGWFEGKLLNTPASHRVNHGTNAQYIDKNYAGSLIIWDRMFGTYEPEIEKVTYGVTNGFVGHNRFIIQLAPLWKYLWGEWKREKDLQRSSK